MSTPEFFDATTELNTIYRWARARYAAPWAVFGAVLLRVAASTGPEVQLPGLIGGRASLNLMAAFVAPSGGGKGISDKVARLAWPADIIERPVGSGEGIAALFAPPKKEGAERITRAIISVPEIDTLAGIASRQGSILLAQLKSMVMGELIGQWNASEANSRVVQPHTYRCCMSIGAQPGHCSVIFSDTTGGTPQRVLWFPTTDPDMPATPADDPEPLNTNLPAWARMSTGVVEIQYGPEQIAQTVIAAHVARQRGDADALDGHALLTRCKVAAVLAIMHHRMVVSELDWQLSEQVMAVSDTTRNWILDEAKRAERAKVRERAIARAAGEQFIAEHKLERAKKAILRWLERDGQLARHDLRRKLKADLRDHFDPAIAELTAESIIAETPVKNGVEYGLNAEGTRVPPVHPTNLQVNARVPEVHGVPDATVTDQQKPSSPPSRSVTPPESEPREEPVKAPVKAPRPTTCKVCYVALPAAATEPYCDEHEGGQAKSMDAQPAPQPALHVAYNGEIAKRDGGLGRSLDRIRYHRPAPTRLVQQTPKETV